MSDDQHTVKMPAVTADDDSATSRLESDQTLTDEFRVDQDVEGNEATRRLDSQSMKAVVGPGDERSGTHADAAVPGENATMPLPAVAASKTEANRVPEEVLAAMRSEEAGKATTPSRPPIQGESVVKPKMADEVGPDDETVDRARPNIKPLMADSMTEEQYPAVSFTAEIDGEGKIFIPRQYMGMLRYGQKVAVQVQVIPDMDS